MIISVVVNGVLFFICFSLVWGLFRFDLGSESIDKRRYMYSIWQRVKRFV